MLYRPYTTTNTMLTPSHSSFNLMIRNILEWHMFPTFIKRNMLLQEYEYKRKFDKPMSSIDSLINEIYRIYTLTSMISESEYLSIEKDLQHGIFEFKPSPIIYNVTNLDFNIDYNNKNHIVIHSLLNLILNKMKTYSFSQNCYSQSESSIDDWYDVISKWHGLKGIISLDYDYNKLNSFICRSKLIAQVSPFLDNDVNLLKLLSSFLESLYIDKNGIKPLNGFPSVSNSHAVLLNIALTELDLYIERMLPDIEFSRYENIILIPIYDISIYTHICSILQEIFKKSNLYPISIINQLEKCDIPLVIDDNDQKEIFFNKDGGTLSIVSKSNHKI